MSYTFKPFEELEFTDDWMFGKVMRNPEICKEILELLLDVKIEKLEYPILQKELNPYYSSKGIRCDVYVKDSDRVFDIEIQNYRQKNLGKRMRYYQSILDCDDLIRGSDYYKLKDSYILFICKTPPFESSNLPCYTFKNFCEENRDIQLDDNCVKEVYNASAFAEEKNEKIKAFLNFICNQSASNTLTDRISNLVHEIKQNEANKTEYAIMNPHEIDIFLEGEEQGLLRGKEIGLAEGEQRGKIAGAQKAKIETAKNALALGLPVEQITQLTGLDKSEIEKLRQE